MNNKAGATIYENYKDHPELAIPEINNSSETGKIYNVLSVGMHTGRQPLITIKEGNKVTAYKSPEDLFGWVEDSIMNAMSGNKSFPSEVEFGKLDGRVYAEFVM